MIYFRWKERQYYQHCFYVDGIPHTRLPIQCNFTHRNRWHKCFSRRDHKLYYFYQVTTGYHQKCYFNSHIAPYKHNWYVIILVNKPSLTILSSQVTLVALMDELRTWHPIW